jgi:hypothetical protein
MKGKLFHRKETPGVPLFGLFGVRRKKNERGTKKAGASSNIRWEKARKARKLKRVEASLRVETYPKGREYGSSRERKPLKRRYQAGGSDEKASERNKYGKPCMRLGKGAKP